MTRAKRKLSAREKAEKKRQQQQQQQEYEWIFLNGKQKRVRRAPTIDGMPIDEYILRNADSIWLHQHGEWEHLYARNEMEGNL